MAGLLPAVSHKGRVPCRDRDRSISISISISMHMLHHLCSRW